MGSLEPLQSLDAVFSPFGGKPANAFEQRTDEQIQHDRETALFLFRKLTGKDFGYDVEKWIVYFEEHEDEIIEGDETMNGEPL